MHVYIHTHTKLNKIPKCSHVYHVYMYLPSSCTAGSSISYHDTESSHEDSCCASITTEASTVDVASGAAAWTAALSCASTASE